MGQTLYGMEHRCGTRVKLGLPCEVRTTTGSILTAQVINASITGALLRTHTLLPLLSQISVRPLIAGAAGGDWLQAFVVRRSRHQIGVEWLDPDVDVVRALLALPLARTRIRRPGESGLRI